MGVNVSLRLKGVLVFELVFLFYLKILSADFKGNPYLCTPNWSEAENGEVTVCWIADADMVGQVTYAPASQPTIMVGPEGSNIITQGVYKGSYRMWVRLKNLQSGVTYQYHISGNGISGEKGGEIYVPQKDDPLLIVSFGDWGPDADNTEMPTTMQIVAIESRVGKKVDLFVDVGDTRQHDGLYQFTGPAQLSRIPIFVALGNHEGDKGAATPWEHFYLPSGVPGHNGFFTVRWGSAYFVVYAWAQSVSEQYYGFKSNYGGNNGYVHLEWLKDAISQAPSDAQWRCLVQHQPIFSVYEGTPCPAGNIYLPQEIWPTLRQNKFAFVLSGHDHHFLRTYPIADADGNLPQGFVKDPSTQIDISQGTTQLVTAGSTDPHASVIPPWEAFFSNMSGPMYMVLYKTEGQGEFLTDNLNLLHRFTFTLDASGLRRFEDMANNLDVRIFPNPFYSEVSIELGDGWISKGQLVFIDLYDIYGRLFKEVCHSFELGQRVILDKGMGLSSGLYMLRIRSGSLVAHHRVMVYN